MPAPHRIVSIGCPKRRSSQPMSDHPADTRRHEPVPDERRADAAARAIAALLPRPGGVLLDLAGGTGAVSHRLADRHRVMVVDRTGAVLRRAAVRLPGRQVRADAARLPVRDGAADAVACVWLLHLLPPDTVAAVIGEIARVLRPGGRFVTTVDKHFDHGTATDVDAALEPLLVRLHGVRASDDSARLTALAAGHGLIPAGRTRFTGHGQGIRPGELADLLDHRYPQVPADLLSATEAALRRLPDPDRPRADPRYLVAAFVRPP